MNTKLNTLIVNADQDFSSIPVEHQYEVLQNLHSIIVMVNPTLGLQIIVEECPMFNERFDEWEVYGYKFHIWGQYNLGPVYETKDTHLDLKLFLNHIKSLNWDELTAQMVNWHEDWYARENPEETWGQDVFYSVKQFVDERLGSLTPEEIYWAECELLRVGGHMSHERDQLLSNLFRRKESLLVKLEVIMNDMLESIVVPGGEEVIPVNPMGRGWGFMSRLDNDKQELFIQGKKRMALEGKQLWLAIQMLSSDSITTAHHGTVAYSNYHKNDVLDFGFGEDLNSRIARIKLARLVGKRFASEADLTKLEFEALFDTKYISSFPFFIDKNLWGEVNKNIQFWMELLYTETFMDLLTPINIDRIEVEQPVFFKGGDIVSAIALATGVYIDELQTFCKENGVKNILAGVFSLKNTVIDGIPGRMLPDVSIKSVEWELFKLPNTDPRNLWIGDLVGCCQRIGGAGEGAVLDCWTREDCANYAIRSSSGAIYAYFMAWLSKDGHICIDSIESRDFVPVEMVHRLVRRFVSLCNEDGVDVYISNTSYGITSEVNDLFSEDKNEDISDSDVEEGWFDSDICYLHPSLGDLKYSDAGDGLYKIKL